MGTMPNSYSTYGKIGFVILLTAILAALKLTDQIDWYWWMVLAPIWLAAILGVVWVILGPIVARAHRDKR
jgi:hypothetical protein